jgi:ubiquinone/menaquinone biosynthesis C-methylase UbiE
MSERNFKLTDYFEPEQWAGIYGAGKKNDSAFIFRHGTDLVFDISSRLGRPGGLWLDIGCGTGDLAAKLSETGWTVVGLDHDPRMIDFAKKRFLVETANDNLKFVPANAYDLPFGDETVDGITAVSLVGCLASPVKFFRQVHRVLRKGGFAVITFTNRASFLLKINAPLRKIMFKTRKSAADSFLFRFYRCASVTEDLQNIGLRVVETRFYNFFLNPANRLFPPESFALYLEGLNKYKIGRRLARNFIIVAQKM